MSVVWEQIFIDRLIIHFQNDKSEIAEVGGTSETDGANENFEWEECNECSQIESCTQNFDTLVSVPFDLDSIKSIQYPTSTTKTPECKIFYSSF